jgi:hypothetical protein
MLAVQGDIGYRVQRQRLLDDALSSLGGDDC